MAALQEGLRSTCLRPRGHPQVCRATSRRLCRNPCTDRLLLIRAAGSSSSTIGIDRSADQEQLGSLQPLHCTWRAVAGGCCGCRGRTLLWAMLCQALLRLSHGLYGQSWPCVLHFHDVCGHGGRLGWHGAARTVVMCVAVDHVSIHVIRCRTRSETGDRSRLIEIHGDA